MKPVTDKTIESQVHPETPLILNKLERMSIITNTDYISNREDYQVNEIIIPEDASDQEKEMHAFLNDLSLNKISIKDVIESRNS